VRKLGAVALVLAAACAACGYALAGSGLGDVSRVAIRTPSNDSTLPGVEYVVADALRREVLRRDGASLTEDPAGADLVVSGAVRRIASRSRAFTSAILAREQELEVELQLEAVRRDGSRLEVGKGALRETERFLASADIEAQRKNEEEALHRVAGVLAARFFDSVSEALAK
jgi:hypothetical protein